MAELASSSPVLGMQWAGPGSTEAAVSLLAAAGVSVPPSPVTPLPQKQPPTAGGRKKGGKGKVRATKCLLSRQLTPVRSSYESTYSAQSLS